MNIFYLSEDPIEAAQLQYNKHVVKMPLESAQMLCTAHREYGNENVPYKATHRNHPSAVWARSSLLAYDWLYRHMMALGREYTARYGKTHLAITKCSEALSFPPTGIPCVEWCQPPQSMPEKYHDECSITAYWNYYEGEKFTIATTGEQIRKRSL